MHTITENLDAALHLQAIADVMLRSGSLIANDLTIHERGGDFWCSIIAEPGIAGRPLLAYPPECKVPMDSIQWADDPHLLRPIDGLSQLSDSQRCILDHWLILVNEAGKLDKIRQRHPLFALKHKELRGHLAAAGYPDLNQPPPTEAAALHKVLIGCHSCSGIKISNGEKQERQQHLIPLHHFFNHHPDGGTQGQTSPEGWRLVTTGRNSSDDQTFENYGDLDALQLLMAFGYVEGFTPVVHSVPAELDGGAIGSVRLIGRTPRYLRGLKMPDAPRLWRKDDGQFTIQSLSIRSKNRHRVRECLSLVYQGIAKLGKEEALRAADRLLDDVVQANLVYYQRLDALLAQVIAHLAHNDFNTAQEVGAIEQMLEFVSRDQQNRITHWWGR
jgi:hypothetical protein